MAANHECYVYIKLITMTISTAIHSNLTHSYVKSTSQKLFHLCF